ncbi:MAG: T9SS type A sorting domain-containing protein [Aequorivita sp.]|nr:T9SS type A sorting domain-containing protein [Aequorivita sp.]
MKRNLLKLQLLFAFSLLLLATSVQSQWQQKGTDIFGLEYDTAGGAIAISADGNLMAVGASQADPNGSQSGNVRVFEWDGTQWLQRGQTLGGEAANNKFGYSVSLTPTGNRLAVGATGAAAGGYPSAGNVSVFDWNGSSWEIVGSTIDGVYNDINSGWSVSLDGNGNRVAISAPHAGLSGTQIGEVRIYTFDGSDWSQLGNVIEGENQYDYMGHSIKLSANGERVAIGTHMNDDFATDAGSVDIYEWNGSQWAQMGNRLTGTEETDWFGRSIDFSADGNRIVAGAWHHGEDRGQVRAFEWNGSEWEQLGQSINGENDYDNSGHSVSLSADGTTMAIGSVQNPGGGEYRGQTRVFKLVDTTWLQVDNGINGLFDNEYGGYNTAISANGETVLIGMPLSSANGTYAGAVRAYEGGVLGVDSSEAMEFVAFPNPASNLISIAMERSFSQIEIVQYDILGNKVNSATFQNSKEVDFPLRGQTGIYFLIVQADNSREIIRVVKE